MKIPFSSIIWSRNLALITIFACVLSACSERPDTTVGITGLTMGTSYSIKVVSDDLDATALQAEMDELLVHLNQVYSTYVPDSELSVLNHEAGANEVSDELMKVLMLSQEIHGLSEGAFDPTVGPLVNLWGFGPDGPRNGVPAATEIASALANTGFDRLTLDGNTVTKPAHLMVDLSAIAKGYAVDVVCDRLLAKGEHRFLVEIGGEVRANGTNGRGQPWVIGIEAPDMQVRRIQRTMPLKNLGMATSGDYRNFFEYEDHLYSHTLDPDTGWPVSHKLASVTVLHPSAGYADGLATAFSVMGEQATLELAEANNLLVLAIIRENGGYKEVLSSRLEEYLAQLAGQ